jgi:acetylornithine deacetylase/succinyl-diaminopimelate desuccinylase-like protein
MTPRTLTHLTVFALVLVLGYAAQAGVAGLEPHQQLARDILRELTEINTTDSVGDNTAAANAMAQRLLQAGFTEEAVSIIEPHPKKGNLVARYRGIGDQPPILLLAHLDVVEAHPEDWSFDPFVFREEGGYFYGRGTSDNKDMAAIWIANLIRMKQEGFTPNRDLIVALTADEEGGDHNGVQWLLANQRELIDAAFCLNEGGIGSIRQDRYISNGLQLSEKVYITFELEVTNPGGHSSLPEKENAIYRLAKGLSRLADFDFPVQLDDITKVYFERQGKIEGGEIGQAMLTLAQNPSDSAAIAKLSAEPYFNSQMRTTCVVTQISGGHAENALPQTARATINCRMLPSHDPQEVQATLLEVLDDDAISLAVTWKPTPSPPSPLSPEVLGAVEKVTGDMWPEVTVLPTMLAGATDGLFLRNAGIPTYGISGIFHDVDDIRAHGRDERVGVEQFFEGQEFLYRLVKELASP